MIGVYKITNMLDNKIYVGSSIAIEKRFISHKNDLTSNIHHNSKLQRAWNKHGAANFKFEIMRVVDNVISARLIEQEWLDKLIKSESYNLSKNANGASFGEDNPAKRKEVRQKITDALTGKKLTLKARTNISKSVTLRWADTAYKQRLSGVRFKLWQTPEYREAMLLAGKKAMARLTTEEKKLKYGSLLGTKNTEETRHLKSIAVKARWADPQEAEKLKLSMRGKKINVQCPHCPKYGGISNMKRYHFDNCKNK